MSMGHGNDLNVLLCRSVWKAMERVYPWMEGHLISMQVRLTLESLEQMASTASTNSSIRSLLLYIPPPMCVYMPSSLGWLLKKNAPSPETSVIEGIILVGLLSPSGKY